MRMIYRSASKRQLTESSPSLAREALARFRSSLLSVFYRLGNFRSALCRFFFCGLAWAILACFLVPLAGPLSVICLLWRRRAVPRICKRFMELLDVPETSVNLPIKGTGFSHLLIKLQGPPCLSKIKEQLSNLVVSKSTERGGWKLTRRLVRLPFDSWAWRNDTRLFDVDNHVTLCDEVWAGASLNERSLKYKVNELCGVALSGHRPPWHVHVVPFTQTESKSSCHALLIRAHQLIDHHFQKAEDFYSCNSEVKVLRNAVAVALSKHNDENERCPTESDIFDPYAILESRYETISKAFKRFVSTLLFIWQAPAICFNELICSFKLTGTHGISSGSKGRRALCWSDPLPRDLLHRLKEASGAESSESVLLSCLAGAFHQYRQRSAIPDVNYDTVRSLTPQNYGFLSFVLPVGECCPKSRLRRVQRSLQRGLTDIRYPLSRILASNWSKVIPTTVAVSLANSLAKRYPVLVDHLYLSSADCSVMEVHHWNASQVEVGLSLKFVHYGEHVSLSAMSDYETLQRPDWLMSCFNRAVLDLALALGVRCERKPSPPPTPTHVSGRSF